ncbi:hypothetical protein GDO78_021439 [Eleutherodactylus coqui]|uniref:Uncharacterized protein n=1 Tax=Eleutherodactylus coqui TaxID=57060 RepID=A0A8J6EHF3_ELECQ|nr:hypothetical protein GDO78_021439 [Eleutherodactylus coqui]
MDFSASVTCCKDVIVNINVNFHLFLCNFQKYLVAVIFCIAGFAILCNADDNSAQAQEQIDSQTTEGCDYGGKKYDIGPFSPKPKMDCNCHPDGEMECEMIGDATFYDPRSHLGTLL